MIQKKSSIVLFAISLFVLMSCASQYKSVSTRTNNDADFLHKMVEIESRVGARLGVAIIDMETKQEWGYHANDRFPMCSTFKALACSAVLAKVDSGKENLQHRMVFEKSDLITWSPVTETRFGGNGMSMAELCEAAITQSDNTAANLILKTLGGPAGVTDFAKTLNDHVTRLDRIEPALNEAIAGDERDTTTPNAMATDLRKLLFENALSVSSQEQLKTWLIANKTGDTRIRAALPKDWIVGDKTGTGAFGSTNDVAVIWPPHSKPIIIAVYITQSAAQQDVLNAAVADVGKTLVKMISK